MQEHGKGRAMFQCRSLFWGIPFGQWGVYRYGYVSGQIWSVGRSGLQAGLLTRVKTGNRNRVCAGDEIFEFTRQIKVNGWSFAYIDECERKAWRAFSCLYGQYVTGRKYDPRPSGSKSCISALLCGIGRFFGRGQGAIQNQETANACDGRYERNDVQIPLLPQRPAPIILFCGMVLFFGGAWLSDYGFMVPKSEAVSTCLWLSGWLIAVCGGLLVLGVVVPFFSHWIFPC